MSYVDAGYAIALSVLALYALGLVLRRRRLTRAASLAAFAAEPGRRPSLGGRAAAIASAVPSEPAATPATPSAATDR